MTICTGISVESGTPFFSICIPQYNRTSFVIEALRVLASQSFKDFEVCISDDCSSDGRQSEVQRALRDLKLRHVYKQQSENGRYDKNLRSAISLSTGRYCLLMGNDDCLADRNALMRLHGLIAQQENIGVVITNYVSQASGTVSRRVRATRTLGSGPGVAARCFRNFSFVSGVILRRDRAVAHATSKWDGAEMYQMYLGSRIIGEGYDLVEFAEVIVIQGLQIVGQTVDSYAAKPRLEPCPIEERKTPLVQLGRLVIDAIRPYDRDRMSGLAVFIFVQILVFTYPFWIVEYRRVQSWKYAVGICLGMRPRNILETVALHQMHSLFLKAVYFTVTLAGLMMPIRLFDFLRSEFYGFAKSVSYQ